MVRGSKIFLMMILAGLFLLAGAYAGAQEKAPAPAPSVVPAPPPTAVPPPPAAPETGKIGEMAPPATAQGVKEPPYSKPYPMGFITIHLKHVGAGVGVQWGKGVLTYKGKKYTFKVKGLQIGTVGISTVTAKGEVYNLFQLAQFAGQYGAVEASAAVIKGRKRRNLKTAKMCTSSSRARKKG